MKTELDALGNPLSKNELKRRLKAVIVDCAATHRLRSPLFCLTCCWGESCKRWLARAYQVMATRV